MTKDRQALTAALWVFTDRRNTLAAHLIYLGCDWTRAAEFRAMVAWANVPKFETERFSVPGSCWICDQNWVREVKDAGDRVRPLLDREIVLGHCVRIALTMNPMLIATQMNVQPHDLARRLETHLTLEQLGGARGD